MAEESNPSPPKVPLQAPNSANSKSNNDDRKRNKKQQLPTPEEILSHYESQGLDTRAASLEAISHLQSLLFKSVVSNSASGTRKVDSLNARLAIIEAKLDSKPGFFESFAIGFASGAVFNSVGSTLPHVVHGLSSAWSSVRAVTANSNSNSNPSS